MRSYDLVAAIATRQHGLIARWQAAEAGLTSSAFGRLVRSYLDRVHPGVYRVRGVPPSREQRLLAACLAAGPEAAVSHRAAAASWGLVEGQREVVEIVTPRRQWPRLTHVTVHRSTDLRPGHVTHRNGVPTTNPMRTLIDLGAVCSRTVVADALERGLVARLFHIVAVEAMVFDISRPGRSGGGVLRRVLDDRALKGANPDSLLEPRMGRILRSLGEPFEFQHVIRDGRGVFVARVDFAYPDAMLAIEVDGLALRASPESLAADYVRQNQLTALGWRVIRFTWHQVVRQPSIVAKAVQDALVTSVPAFRS